MRWLIRAIEAGRAPDLRRVLSTLTSARYAEELLLRASKAKMIGRILRS
jgi:hypothetical protein